MCAALHRLMTRNGASVSLVVYRAGAGLIFCVVPSIEIRSRHGPAQFGNVQTEAKWRRKRTSPPRAVCSSPMRTLGCHSSRRNSSSGLQAKGLGLDLTVGRLASGGYARCRHPESNYFLRRIMHISSSDAGQSLSAFASPYEAIAAGWLIAGMSEHFLWRRNRSRIAAHFRAAPRGLKA